MEIKTPNIPLLRSTTRTKSFADVRLLNRAAKQLTKALNGYVTTCGLAKVRTLLGSQKAARCVKTARKTVKSIRKTVNIF